MAKYQFKTKPFAHQAEALKRGWNHKFFAYLMEMGTGKTKVAIDNACILYERGHINGLVIIAPKGVYQNWPREIDIHMPDRIRSKAKIAFWRSHLPKYTLKEIADAANTPNLGVFIINVESFVSDKTKKMLTAFLERRNCMVVVDESTTIKNAKAKRSKAITQICANAVFRRILTGSPVVNNPMDLFGQSQFLKPGLLAKSEAGYQTQFCVTRDLQVDGIDKKTGKPRKFTVRTVVGSKNIDRLQEKIASWSYRARKAECLDLPEKIYQVRNVEITDEQKTLYEKFKSIAYHEFEDGSEMSADVVIKQLLRLHQIVCGYAVDDEGNVRPLKSRRMDVLMETLQEVDGKVIIWANYLQNIHDIYSKLQEAYGREAVVAYYGGTSLDDRDYAVKALQNGPARFLVGNTQTAGYGLTLTAATTHVYYSNNYNLELRAQSEDRSHRIGQHSPVTYIDLVTAGTVDDRILHALRNKIDLAAAILQDSPRKWVI